MGIRRWPWTSQKQVEWEAGADDEAPVYLIETHARSDIGKVEAQIADLLPGRVSIEPVFPLANPESENERVGEAFDLRCFWSARLPGPAFAEWDESPYDLAYELAAIDGVRSVEPDLPTAFFATSSTSALGSSCEVPDSVAPKDLAWALRHMCVPDAWQVLQAQGLSQGKDIRIGQPDTGVAAHDDVAHCVDLQHGLNLLETGKLPLDPLTGPKFGKNIGHGTAVSSVAVSRGRVLPNGDPPDFGTGAPGRITGVSTEATIVPVRAIRSVIRITQRKVAKAVDFCVRQKLHVVSMSLGGLAARSLEAAIAKAVAEQLIVVCAAGNCVRIVVFPARYRSTIALAGSNVRDEPWRGTSRGKQVDVTAPAEHVWRALAESPADPPDLIHPGQGTSFATALTAGAAALWLNDRRAALLASLAPGATLQELFRACLKSTAYTPTGWNTAKFGAGIVNANKLVGCQAAASAGASGSAPARQDYGLEVVDSAGQLLEELPAHPDAALTQALGQLSEFDRQKFGHEALALIAQHAWMGTSGDAQTAAELGILLLRPSKALHAVLTS
jgi:subtilisin family serine protease